MSLRKKSTPPSAADLERGERIGVWIRTAQARKNVTAREVNEATGISESYYGVLRSGCYDRSKGTLHHPSRDAVERIARFLDADLEEGLRLAGYETSPPSEHYIPLTASRRGRDVTIYVPQDMDDASRQEILRALQNVVGTPLRR